MCFPTEHTNFGATGLTGRRVVCFDPWQRSSVRLWPAMLKCAPTGCWQAALVIFHGMLPPDERTRRVCLLDWNCIKGKGRRKENEPGCHWSESCSVAAWLERMKGLISFDNTQQWVMAPQPPAPSRSFVLFHSSTFFFFFFFLKHGLICRAASATLCLVCLHCVRRSLLLAVCVCLGKHVMGIAANPSRGVTLKCFSPGALRRCGIRWKGSTSCLCGQVPGRGGQSPYWPPLDWAHNPRATLPVPPRPRTAPLRALLVGGWVFVLVCIKYLWVTRKDFCSRGTELQHYLRSGWNVTAETYCRCGVKVWFDEAQASIPPCTHIRSHRMSVPQWAVLTLNWISLSSTRRVTFPFRAEECSRKPIQHIILTQTDSDEQGEWSRETEGVRR